MAAIWGHRRSESAYHAARSAGLPRSPIDNIVMGPLMVVAAARWGILDESLEARVSMWVERAGHARGRALLVQAQGLRALARGEHSKAEKLFHDAAQSFATLKLDHERALALADHARSLTALGRDGDAEAALAEARAVAERIEAVALRATLDATTVRA